MWRRVRKIGILGGMGPAATVDFLAKIVAATPAHCDQEHIPVIVWSDPQTPDRTQALLDPDSPSPVPALRDGAMALERAGADFIAIACNTAHHWHHCIQKATAIPVLHIADVAVDELVRTGARAGGAIGLMGTNGTLVSGHYRRRLEAAGFEVIVPDQSSQATLMTAIEAVKAGNMARGREAAMQTARLLLEHGAERLLLACTELPVALRSDLHAIPFVDATDALAKACVALAMSAPATAAELSDAASPARQQQCQTITTS